MTRVNAEVRAEIEELLARYCHYMDDGLGDAWVALFTADGVFEIDGMTRLKGAGQLGGMPAMFFENSRGQWRHQLTNIITELDEASGDMTAKAYGLVTDWSVGGRLVTFGQYDIRFTRVSGELRLDTVNAKVTAAP